MGISIGTRPVIAQYVGAQEITSVMLGIVELYSSGPSALFRASEQGVWYDPSDIETLFQDTAGTTPVTAAGQSVGKMLDKSGRGNHATFSNVTLGQDGGGKSYLAFNGSTSFGSTSVIDFSGINALSVFAGFQRVGTSSGTLLEMSSNFNSNSAFAIFAPQSSNNVQSINSGPGSAFNSVNYDDVSAPSMGSFSFASNRALSTEVEIRKNGIDVAVTRPNIANTTGNFGSYPIYIGARAGGSIFFNGRLYGLILRAAISSASEVLKTEKFMSRRTTPVVAALGDSTVAAYLGGQELLSLAAGLVGKNLAVPGNTIAQQKAAWQALSAPVKQSLQAVFIQIGLNDMTASEAASAAISRIQDLVATVRADVSATCKVYISKMIPCRQRFMDLFGATDGPISQQKWTDVNDAISGIGSFAITNVDGRITAHVPLMGDGAGNLAAPYDTGDHIHPNDAGRQINANAWRGQLVTDGLLV